MFNRAPYGWWITKAEEVGHYASSSSGRKISFLLLDVRRGFNGLKVYVNVSEYTLSCCHFDKEHEMH